MSSPGLDLLLRVIAKQLAESRCEQCQKPLGGSRIAIRESTPDQVAVEVACPACNHILLLGIKPETDGVARLA